MVNHLNGWAKHEHTIYKYSIRIRSTAQHFSALFIPRPTHTHTHISSTLKFQDCYFYRCPFGTQLTHTFLWFPRCEWSEMHATVEFDTKPKWNTCAMCAHQNTVEWLSRNCFIWKLFGGVFFYRRPYSFVWKATQKGKCEWTFYSRALLSFHKCWTKLLRIWTATHELWLSPLNASRLRTMPNVQILCCRIWIR